MVRGMQCSLSTEIHEVLRSYRHEYNASRWGPTSLTACRTEATVAVICCTWRRTVDVDRLQRSKTFKRAHQKQESAIDLENASEQPEFDYVLLRYLSAMDPPTLLKNFRLRVNIDLSTALRRSYYQCFFLAERAGTVFRHLFVAFFIMEPKYRRAHKFRVRFPVPEQIFLKLLGYRIYFLTRLVQCKNCRSNNLSAKVCEALKESAIIYQPTQVPNAQSGVTYNQEKRTCRKYFSTQILYKE
ncbi:hypothetical protein ANN_21281 [Periplaneta americana]|uniref:Uncharacterized protein n=1 Tax=Periplaneta americana TaxID=6978 RepID=A0ABQ8SEW5_PERAM|nr:hypothetical protein ANN_21281 [Periplaneta americana]